MTCTILSRVVSVAAITLALSAQGLADGPHRLGGAINDYTAVLDAGGPWHMSGEWSLKFRERSGKADFSAALNMVRADNPARAAHTHHLALEDADIMPLTNGFRLTGDAVMTSNGNLAAFSGSTVDVEVTGGNSVAISNVTVTFGGAATAHFGDQPLHGVVTDRR